MTLPGAGLEPTIAAGSLGYASVVWEAGNSTGVLRAADLSPTARVVDIHRVPGSGSTPRLADDGRGDLAGAWGAAAYRPAGHRWCPATELRAASEGYSVAIAPTGVGEVIWDYELGAHGVVRARGLTSCRG